MAGTKRRVWNDRGIRTAARALGVSHVHLWYVIRGERRSLPLLARYKAWQKETAR